MRLLAAGTAAALAAPRMAAAGNAGRPAVATPGRARVAAADSSRMKRTRAGEPGARTALPEEIEKQKQSLAGSLKTIRDFSLPPGSPASFVFRPLRSRRTERDGR